MFEDMFTNFDTIHERDIRTDRQTPRDGMGRTVRSVARAAKIAAYCIYPIFVVDLAPEFIVT